MLSFQVSLWKEGLDSQWSCVSDGVLNKKEAAAPAPGAVQEVRA